MAEASREATGAAPPPLHVVVFPWLAFGHFVPFLELSEHLARRGHAVTFVSAPRNVARLRPVSPRIRLLPLPLPTVDGLPDGAESTADVPPEKVDLLKVAFDGLAAPFARFLDEACAGGDGATEFGKRPDWIFVDFAHYWLPPIAEQHKASAALLPDGFEERVAGRGVVRVGWVPQVRILAHGAVGAFLTHAGLSSLTESFLFGHPLVMLPLFMDQGVTARGMAARGVGLEVPRDEGDGSFGRDDVAATVRRVMAEGEEGEAFARNAGELQAVLWNRAKQDGYVDDLVDHLLCM